MDVDHAALAVDKDDEDSWLAYQEEAEEAWIEADRPAGFVRLLALEVLVGLGLALWWAVIQLGVAVRAWWGS